MAFAFGTFVEVAAETQKKVVLEHNAGSRHFSNLELATDGMFKMLRHP